MACFLRLRFQQDAADQYVSRVHMCVQLETQVTKLIQVC